MNKLDRLNAATLSKLPQAVAVPSYEPASITAGLVHFGIGNFHRAHQAVYCDALLNEGETSWGITGVSMRSPDIRDKLSPQDFLYTQATLGSKTTDYRIIGSVQNILVAPENPQAVIDAVADNNTQLVTTTITEKGYCLSNGTIDRNHPDTLHDIDSLKEPKTIYAYLAAAVIKRYLEQGSPFTVLCCDNIQDGGEHLHKGVKMLLEHHASEMLNWFNKNVSFASSMVDRVTPATTEAFKNEVTKQLDFYDAAPVAAEPFTQWVIQDNFAGERPPFDKVGALFVEDIEPFERVKLRFLNAGHTMLASLGYLAGDTYVHEALQRPALARFTEQALKGDVLPVIPIPQGMNAETYIDEVLERFRNANLPYAVLQVGTDSSQKIQQRWLPSIDDALAQGHEASYMAFALAAWVSFIRKAIFNSELNDPLRETFASEIKNSELEDKISDVQRFLPLAGAKQFAFYNNDLFMATVEKFHVAITELGVEQAIETIQILKTQEAC